MTKTAVVLAGVLGFSAIVNVSWPAPAQSPDGTSGMSPEARKAIVERYCLACHNDDTASGGLDLTALDQAHVERQPELAERVIRKLRAGMMPPPGAARPDAATARSFAAALEAVIDRAPAQTNPGTRGFQRLTRTEYARSIKDLLDIEVDVSQFLPPDTVSEGFDNIADNQSSSPALMDGYIRAASRISREALGDPDATATSVTYRPSRTASQMRHLEGAPFGTRGGIVIEHNFPADGDYVFDLLLYGGRTGELFGSSAGPEKIEVAVNGVRVALLDVSPKMKESDPDGLNLRTGPIAVKAGPQKVSAAFIETFSGLIDDLVSPIEHTLADRSTGSLPQLTHRPHLREFVINGPRTVTGISDSRSRRKTLTCRPASPEQELPCATKIISELAQKAFRRPVTPEDTEGLMTFYEAGKETGGFDGGIRIALQAILSSPHFLFRLETMPRNAREGQSYAINDLGLASRLSFFLWASGPDSELISVASQGRLRQTAELERQVRRMLADPRAEALSTKFAAQWLHLSDLERIDPDFLIYPQYDSVLAEAMRRETELFFDSIVRQDRNVFDLLTADYTFVNERLAMHYRIPSVLGHRFQRVRLTDDNRRGLLGQGSILTLTSIADRTSAVKRGAWVMKVLLGTPPPPPPPNVPELDRTQSVAEGRMLTVRERLETHRANPNCSSCHNMIDPIGLALENFDVTGAWRRKDAGQTINPASELFDGTKLNGPVSLRAAILNYSEAFVRTFTENLMTYALGRRVDYRDMPLVRAIVRDAARNNYRFSSFVIGIVKSPAFRMNTVARSDQ